MPLPRRSLRFVRRCRRRRRRGCLGRLDRQRDVLRAGRLVPAGTGPVVHHDKNTWHAAGAKRAHVNLQTSMLMMYGSQRRGPWLLAVIPLPARACPAAHSVTRCRDRPAAGIAGVPQAAAVQDGRPAVHQAHGPGASLTCILLRGRLGSTCMLGTCGQAPRTRPTWHGHPNLNLTLWPQVSCTGGPQGAAGAHAMGSSSSIGSANSRASSGLPSSRNRKVAWKQPASSQAIQ